jgi:hypothetical protein
MKESNNIQCKKHILGSIFLFVFYLVLLTTCKKTMTEYVNDSSIAQNSYYDTSNGMYLLLLRETKELPKNGLEPVCEIHSKKMYLGNVQIYHNITTTHGSEYENLKLKYFPNTNDPIFVFDDSIYDKYIQDNLKVYICDECNNRRNEIIKRLLRK